MSDDFHILLVEDSPTDVKIIQRALNEANFPHRLTVIPDGRRAIDHLEKRGVAAEPDLVLLDLNLPGLDGCQVLAEIKGNPDLRTIPVVVLTTSKRDEDVLQSYQVGANSYIPKPDDYPRYQELVETLRKYWGETALRPPRRRA